MAETPPPEGKKTVENVLETNETPLYSIESVFPFTLFRDSVHVYETKVVIIYRYFFYLKREFPILIKDLRSVTVVTGFFFSTLVFEITGFETNPSPVTWLWRGESLYVRKLITGLILLSREEVDVKDFSRNQLRENALKLGK